MFCMICILIGITKWEKQAGQRTRKNALRLQPEGVQQDADSRFKSVTAHAGYVAAAKPGYGKHR